MAVKASRPSGGVIATLDLDAIRSDSLMGAINSTQLLGGFAQAASQSLGAMALPQLNMGFMRQIAEMQEQMAETHKRMIEAIRIPSSIFDSLRKTMNAVAEITPRISPMVTEARPFITAFPGVRDEEAPTAVAVTEPPISTQLDFVVLIDGRFEYRGRQLQNLYHTSKHGKLLVMLLEFPEHYVSNEAIKAKLGNFDPVKGIPNLMYELKRALQRDGLEIEVTRRWGEGYQLKSIKSY